MKLTIYSHNNQLLYEMPNIYEGCIEKVTLMSEDYIQLKFALAEPIFFPIGAWCEWKSKRYIVTELQSPTYNESTGGYEYELKLDAYYMAWKLRIYKYKNKTDSLNNRESVFSLTANLKEHIICFLRCLKAEGYKFNEDTEYDYVIDKNSELQEVKTLTYSTVNYIDALNQMAEAWDSEWWVTDNFLHFGKCQDPKETNVDFIIGENVVNMSGSKSQTNYATRIYAFGSTRNMSPNWNKGEAECKVVSVDQTNKTFKVDKDIISSYFENSDKIETYESETIGFSSNSKQFNITQATGSEHNKEYRNYDDISINSEHCNLPEGDYNIGDKIFANAEGNIDFSVRLKCSVNETYGTQEPAVSSATCYVYLYTRNADGTFSPTLMVQKLINFDANGTYQNSPISIPFSDFSIGAENEFYFSIKLIPNFNGKYKGTLTLSEGTKIFIRTSNKFYKITSVLAKLDANGNEEISKIATFYTQTDTYYFKYNDTDVELPQAGDKFHILNIIKSKIPSWWFKANQQDADVIKAIAETRLSLPSPCYIQIDGTEDEEVVEKVLIFDDIYPRTLSKVAEVRPKKQNVMDESGNNATGETYTEYYIKQNEFTFNSEYQLENGENMKVIFQSGALTGLEFEVEFDSDETPQEESGFKTDHQFFRVLRKKFDGGLMLPNGAMHPKIEDEFILSGWDVTRVDDMLMSKAQTELKDETEKELKKMCIDPNTYECTLFSDVAYGRRKITYITDDYGNNIVDDMNNELIADDSGTGLDATNAWDFTLGRYVTLYNTAFFKEGKRISRVMGYEKKMDIPWDSPIYTIGEKATYSRLGEMQKQIDGTNTAVNYKELQNVTSNGIKGNGAGVYLIKRVDTTTPSDTNTYSALRARNEFINKEDDTSVNGQIKFLTGAIVRSSTDGTATAADGICEYF